MDVKKLLNTEVSIAGEYFQLLRVELYNDIGSERHKIHSNLLLSFLKTEDEILNSYTIEELDLIKKMFEGKKNEINENNIFINKLFNRLNNKIYKLISILNAKKLKGSEDNDSLKETCILISLVEYEKADIYLSFLDERINDTYKVEERALLLADKYMLISGLDTDNVERISKRNFQTDKSVYLDSLLYCATSGYCNEVYLEVKRTIALSSIQNIDKGIMSGELNEKSNTIDILFRTMVLLFDNENYESFNMVLTSNDNRVNKYKNLFGDNIFETLRRDRQRHKTLYLKR